jgi:two-component system chemotaxis response regulator CheY
MGLNVLIVDDSETVRAVLIKTLDMAEVPLSEIYEAGNGLQGLEQMREHWVDLIFADINMPEMNGVEMVDRMMEDDELKGIPVIVVSTEGSQPRIEKLKQKGIREFIRKPFTPEAIRDAVNSVIGMPSEN